MGGGGVGDEDTKENHCLLNSVMLNRQFTNFIVSFLSYCYVPHLLVACFALLSCCLVILLTRNLVLITTDSG
jgi:hypothetical protein